jgi:hypothetical protein
MTGCLCVCVEDTKVVDAVLVRVLMLQARQ